MFSAREIDDMFTYQTPSMNEIGIMGEIREQARHLAHKINDLTPASPDQSASIRSLRICVMQANSAIVHRGKY